MYIRAQVDAWQAHIINAIQAQGYEHITPMRISYQSSDNTDLSQIQGILRARHPMDNSVIIKWEINIDGAPVGFGSLHHEIHVLNNLLVVSSLALPPVVTHYPALPVANHQTATVLITKDCGVDLRAMLRQKSLIDKSKTIQSVATALCELHQAGWLHNDIKPSNILVQDATPHNKTVLCDFALCCPINNTAAPMGTPAYLAPERWHGQPASVQSDIYAFGIFMYEILTGERPYQPTDKTATDTAHVWAVEHCQTPIPTLPEKYAHWQQIIEGCLAKHRTNRYRDMLEVLTAINKVNE